MGLEAKRFNYLSFANIVKPFCLKDDSMDKIRQYGYTDTVLL